MDEQRDRTDSSPMTDGRGKEIERRFDALNIKDREWYRLTGIDRKTLNRAIDDTDTSTRESTYTAIFTWLDRLEGRQQGFDRNPAVEDYVEFTIEGNFGVRAVVKGPVRDMDELQAAVARLVREMRSDGGNDPEKP